MNFLELENAHKSYSIKWNTELFNEYKESECWNFVDLNQESVFFQQYFTKKIYERSSI